VKSERENEEGRVSMNGIHDLGGMQDMGSLSIEANEPVFHEDWERGVLGVNAMLTLSGVYTVHEMRFAMEQISPLEYLGSPYYLRWLDAFERILVEKGLVTREELASGRASRPLPQDGRSGGPSPMNTPPTEPLRFKDGDRVRAKNIHPRTHTRLPRYVRGRVGTVTACRPGAFAVADSLAQGKRTDLQHVYSVRFEGSELWGPDAGPKDAVYIDLYESYVEAA
jgi:nitrile hydratase beta subunit